MWREIQTVNKNLSKLHSIIQLLISDEVHLQNVPTFVRKVMGTLQKHYDAVDDDDEVQQNMQKFSHST